MAKLTTKLLIVWLVVFGIALNTKLIHHQVKAAPVIWLAGQDGDAAKAQKSADQNSTKTTPGPTNSDATPTAAEPSSTNDSQNSDKSSKNGSSGAPTATSAGQSGSCPQTFFFVLPTWYEYLDCTADAGGVAITNFAFPDDIPAVAMAFIDMLLRAAGLVAVVAIIASGVGYITAGGSTEKTASHRRRIYNAFIGLAVVSIASVFIRFVGQRLGG